MKITANWLKKYLPEFAINDVNSFRHKVDTRLTEVEDIEIKGNNLRSLIVGEIMEATPHPQNADLKVCKVSTGEGELVDVICGAPNARAGLKSVYCQPGGIVLNPENHAEDIEIGTRDFKGITSNGMLCSPAELGLNHSHEQIIELPDNTPVGMPVTELFKDIVIEIQNKAIPHRPDCFSHLGIAREFGAIFKTKMAEEMELDETVEPVFHIDHELKFSVAIKDEEGCNRFAAIVIDNIQVKPSPLWLQIQLIYCGIRPINNVVDVTNYIMLDVGQPMHAFDYTKVKNGGLTVRKAKKGEKIVTLDGKERELTSKMTIVADSTQPLAVAGVMGGASSEITAETKTIILEAANWEMYQIRSTSRDLGIRTEASTRFEKGLSPSISKPALQRAAQMILDLANGEVVSPLVDIYPNPLNRQNLRFNVSSVKRLLGIEINKDQLLQILESEHIEVVNKNEISADVMNRAELDIELELKVPNYRMDLKSQEDILEEIGRLYGYENINFTLPSRTVAPTKLNTKLELVKTIKVGMAAAGFNEIFSYAMVGDDLYAAAELTTKNLIKIKNPISPELGYIRDQLIPSLLSKVNKNLNSGYQDFGLFELDKVALKGKMVDGLPLQVHKLAGIFVSSDPEMALTYIHRAIAELGTTLNIQLTIDQNDNASNAKKYLHPNKSAEIKHEDLVVGTMGFTHPEINDNFDCKGVSICTFEIDKLVDLFTIYGNGMKVRPFHSISDQAVVIRDISLQDTAGAARVGLILTAIQGLKLPELVHAELLDIFTKDDKRNITFRLFIQSEGNSLEAAQINAIVQQVNDLLTSKFALTARN